MPNARQATTRQIDPEIEYAPGEDARRRWLNVTSQIDDSPLEAPFETFAPAPPRRNTGRLAPTAPLRPAPAPAPRPTTERLTYTPAGMPFAQERALTAPAPVRETRPVGRPSSNLRIGVLGAAAVAGLLAVYVVLSAVFSFVQTKLDDMQYGRPRTTHLDAYVGHAGEGAGQPSHFIAMNLERRIVLIELPGGDTKDATTITGPYLFGDGEDLTPVKLLAQDVNGDGADDLLVTVKNEQLVYINDKAKNAFHLMTPEERASLPAGLATGGTAAPKGAK